MNTFNNKAGEENRGWGGDGEKRRLIGPLRILAILLALFVAAKVVAEVKMIGIIGNYIPPVNTITVQGKGEEIAIPDLAELTFDVSEESATVAKAQEAVTTKMNGILEYLKSQDIKETDIKTNGYQIYPEYESDIRVCPLGSYCPPGRQVLRGYRVTHSVAVKVRDIDKAGEILSGLGTRAVTNLGGLSLMVDEVEKVQAEARRKAIEDARAKAKILANDLDVRLVRIVAFNEGGGGGVYNDKVAFGAALRESAAAPVPEIPEGETKITSYVTIVYEIR